MKESPIVTWVIITILQIQILSYLDGVRKHSNSFQTPTEVGLPSIREDLFFKVFVFFCILLILKGQKNDFFFWRLKVYQFYKSCRLFAFVRHNKQFTFFAIWSTCGGAVFQKDLNFGCEGEIEKWKQPKN